MSSHIQMTNGMELPPFTLSAKKKAFSLWPYSLATNMCYYQTTPSDHMPRPRCYLPDRGGGSGGQGTTIAHLEVEDGVLVHNAPGQVPIGHVLGLDDPLSPPPGPIGSTYKRGLLTTRGLSTALDPPPSPLDL